MRSMRCKDVERSSSAYIDNELDPERARALRGHLGQCAACRRMVSDLAAMVEAAAQLPGLEPPPGMWAAIEHELARPEPARSWWQRLEQRFIGHAIWPPRASSRASMVLALAAALVIGVWGARWFAPPDRPADDAPGDSLARFARDTGAERAGVLEPALAFARLLSVELASHREIAADATFLGQRAGRVLAADQQYTNTIRELRELVAEERVAWSAEVVHAFDQRLRAFDAAAERHRQALASLEPHDVSARDALYDVYRAEIAFLQRAALDGPPELGAQP